jgi:poly-gamma-glutamate synthesis protein (capsule biosynthesis protein)
MLDIYPIFANAMKTFRLLLYIATILFAVGCGARKEETDSSAPQITSDTVRLVFGGDLMQHMPQIKAARQGDGTYDYSRSLEYITPIFRDADIAVLNLETTITTSQNYSGYPCFASPIALVDEMVDMGIDISLLANNHCCDKGLRGITTTIETLTERDIRHSGAYRDSTDYHNNNILHFSSKGVRFALVNYTYGTNGMPVPKGTIVNLIDTTRIQRDLRSISRDSVDCIIACMHWGNEYERRANKSQKNLANMLRREGVDIIIGSHPHVVQPYSADSLGVVYYSLGNLVSNQQWRYSDGGIIAEVKVIRCDTTDGLRYHTTPRPVWVLYPEYRVLPRSVGDTLTMSTEARAKYEQFMSDTEKLLGI